MRRSFRMVTLASAVMSAFACRGGSAHRSSDAMPADAGSFKIVSRPSGVPMDLPGSIYAAPSRPHPLAEKLCHALHVLPGRRVGECCGAPPSSFLFDECVRVVGASMESGAVELDPAAVETCAKAAEASLVGCDWVTPGEPLAPPACQGLLRGKILLGGVCRSSLECDGHLHCEGLSPTRTGTCFAPQPSGAGCGPHVDVLATYLLERGLERSRPFCSEFCSLVTHKCEPMPQEGARCFAAVNCAPGHSCVAGTCSSEAAGAAGDPCSRVPCGAGLVCREGTCTTAAPPGEVCRTDFDCQQGGCVQGSDGRRTCGKKCTVSFDALATDGGMRLPLRPASSLGRGP